MYSFYIFLKVGVLISSFHFFFIFFIILIVILLLLTSKYIFSYVKKGRLLFKKIDEVLSRSWPTLYMLVLSKKKFKLNKKIDKFQRFFRKRINFVVTEFIHNLTKALFSWSYSVLCTIPQHNKIWFLTYTDIIHSKIEYNMELEQDNNFVLDITINKYSRKHDFSRYNIMIWLFLSDRYINKKLAVYIR